MSKRKTRKRSIKKDRRKRRALNRERNKWQERREIINQVAHLKTVQCMDCRFPDPAYVARLGRFPYWVMDFDHRPGVRKRGNISAMARDPRYTIEDIIAEIKKCDVVCANCHRTRTHTRLELEISKENWYG